MKFRWIPVLILISILVGVVLGIRIHDLGSVIPQKEKQIGTNPTNSQKQNIIENLNKVTVTNQSQNQDSFKEESAEVFLNTSKAKKTQPQSKRSLLSKMAKGIDSGVSNVFSHLISRLN